MDGRRAWWTFWVIWTWAVVLVALWQSPAPWACRLWWRDAPCYPAAEAAYLQHALERSTADYMNGGRNDSQTR